MPSSKVCGILIILGPLDLNFFEWAQNLALCIILHLPFEFFFSKFFFIIFFFRKLFPFFFFEYFIKSYLIFFFENFSSLQKKLFFFFGSSPLARINCSLPLKVHEILIILGLGMQQRDPRLGSSFWALKDVGC